MATTIQISKDLKDTLERMKFVNSESYEEIIWDLIDNTIDSETLKDIEQGRKDYKEGRYISISNVKKKLGL